MAVRSHQHFPSELHVGLKQLGLQGCLLFGQVEAVRNLFLASILNYGKLDAHLPTLVRLCEVRRGLSMQQRGKWSEEYTTKQEYVYWRQCFFFRMIWFLV